MTRLLYLLRSFCKLGYLSTKRSCNDKAGPDIRFQMWESRRTFVRGVKLIILDSFTMHWLNMRQKGLQFLLYAEAKKHYQRSNKALSYLWCSPCTMGILIPIISHASAPTLLPLLSMLPSLFGDDSSLQNVILPLLRNCCCLSAQRNCLAAHNLEIKRETRRDCPRPFHTLLWWEPTV